MEHVYLARQVILREDASLFAYEVLYRDADKTSRINNNRFASSAVISAILNRFGTKEVLKEKQAFIKIDEKFLLGDLIFTIPHESFIFSLFDDIEMNARVIERIEQLHNKGYTLAISDTSVDIHTFEKYRVIINFLSYIKIDFSQELDKDIKDIIKNFQESGVKVIASKVDTHEKFDHAKELGCDYFQGYYFAQPKIMEKDSFHASRANVLHLYNLLMQETNIDELASEFEKNPEISVQLLQFINSGAFFFMKRISSIHHVITLLGRVKLAEWLMLMIYSKSVGPDNEHSPLMQMVQTRAVLMEKILKVVKPDARSNMKGEAYFVGVLSLLDVVLGSSMEELLESLHISNEVRDAIMFKKGLLGDIFQLVLDVEAFHIEGITIFETKYNLDPKSIRTALADSIDFEAKR